MNPGGIAKRIVASEWMSECINFELPSQIWTSLQIARSPWKLP